MKDPKKTEEQDKDKMAVITCYERMIVGDKIRLDTERYKHRFMFWYLYFMSPKSMVHNMQ